jgi:hypothetical protein
LQQEQKKYLDDLQARLQAEKKQELQALQSVAAEELACERAIHAQALDDLRRQQAKEVQLQLDTFQAKHAAALEHLQAEAAEEMTRQLLAQQEQLRSKLDEQHTATTEQHDRDMEVFSTSVRLYWIMLRAWS